MNSGSIWERIVLDARSRGCYHNADEDDRLSHAITNSIIDLGQVGDLLHLSSPLFRKARWKVRNLELFSRLCFYLILKKT